MIDDITYVDSWPDVKAAARTTVSKDGSGKYPDASWRKQILLAEHSPIRLIRVGWVWKNLKSWVSVHFVRHHIGIDHFVSTQRSDRTGEDRDSKPQDSPVSHRCVANAQALINISRKRLCMQASSETRSAWMKVKGKIEDVDPVLASVMVPECIYRGFCPEMHGCGFDKTTIYQRMLEEYRRKEVTP